MHEEDGTKWLTAARLIELLATLPADSRVMPNTVGNLDVDALMTRCQIGVGGRNALDNAHSIMAECYGTLGRQQIEIERLRAALAVAYGLAPYYISGPYPTDSGSRETQ